MVFIMKLIMKLLNLKKYKTIKLNLGRRDYKLVKKYMNDGFNVYFDSIKKIWYAVKTILV